MSVFAEPSRIIDKDEAVELLTAVLPDVNAHELRERLGSRKGFIWVKRAITPKEQQEVFHLGLPGVGFLPENKRVYPNGPIAAHVLGFVNMDNIGIAGIEKYIDGQGLADLHGAGFSLTPENLKPVTTVARSQGDSRVARRTRQRYRQIQGQGGRGGNHRRQYRRSHRAGVLARLRSQQPGRRARPEPDQPHLRRRLRNGLDLQGDFARHGARFGQGHAGLAASTRATACATGGSPFTIFTPRIGC